MIGGLKLELLQDWLKNDAIKALKWCDLGINRTTFSQSDCSNHA